MQLAYTSYKIISVGIKLYDIYNQIQKQKDFSEEISSNLIKGGVSEGAKKISEPIASSIAQEIRKSAEETGIIKQISENTKIDKEVYSSMLEGTMKEQMLFGIKDLTSYTIGGLL